MTARVINCRQGGFRVPGAAAPGGSARLPVGTSLASGRTIAGCLAAALVFGYVMDGQTLPQGWAAALGVALVAWLWWSRRSPRRVAGDFPGHGREAAQAAGMLGELRVAATLQRDLPDGFVVVNGLMLPRAAGDIDHLVVGPTGVFLLETKTMAGAISCDDDGVWRRTRTGRAGTPYTAFIGDPTTQVERNIRAVRATLDGRGERLARRLQLWIEGLIVFAHPDAVLSADKSRVPAVHLRDVVADIVGHTPRRVLQPRDVDELVEVLLAHAEPSVAAKRPAQTVVELALVLPAVLALVFGVVATSRLVQAQMALVGVAQEAARAGALATNPRDATTLGVQRGEEVAAGYGLGRGGGLQVSVDASRFESGGRVAADASYTVDLADVPLVGWAPSPTVRAQHVEWVDPFRSGIGP